MDVISSIQSVAAKIPPTEKDAFIKQALRCASTLVRTNSELDKKDFRNVTTLKKESKAKKTTLLQTDKSGKFALLPTVEFQRKAKEAVEGLFRPSTENLKQLKGKVVDILKEYEMGAVLKSVLDETRASLSITFFVKDHKPALPLRVVINENGSWQKLASRFLQKCLASVDLGSSVVLKIRKN